MSALTYPFEGDPSICGPIYPFQTHPASTLDLPLFDAVERGDVAGVERALASGASMRALNGEMLLPIQVAAMLESPVVLMLLASKVDDPSMLLAPKYEAGRGEGLSVMDLAMSSVSSSKACAIALIESGMFEAMGPQMVENFERAIVMGCIPAVRAFAKRFDLARRALFQGAQGGAMTALEAAAVMGSPPCVAVLLRCSKADDPPGHFAQALAIFERNAGRAGDGAAACADAIREALAQAEKAGLARIVPDPMDDPRQAPRI